MLSKGMRDKPGHFEIHNYQVWLNVHGFKAGAIDGYFGPVMEKAVYFFQDTFNKRFPKTPIVEDGIIGPQTIGAMRQYGQPISPGPGVKVLIGPKTQELNDLWKVQIKDPFSFHEALEDNAHYLFYKDDVYAPGISWDRIKKGLPVNCVDGTQDVVKPILTELLGPGKVRFVHGVVTCNDLKQYGHIWAEYLIGRDWNNPDDVKVFDYVEATKTHKGFNKVCCIAKKPIIRRVFGVDEPIPASWRKW